MVLFTLGSIGGLINPSALSFPLDQDSLPMAMQGLDPIKDFHQRFDNLTNRESLKAHVTN